MLAEHDAIKREVSAMRDMMEERKREYIADDDDARSVTTIGPHELERVEEEDEEQMAAEEEEERRRRSNEVRPRTPEPTGMGMHEDDDEHEPQPSRLEEPVEQESSAHLRVQSPTPAPSAVPDELAQRLTSLANQLETALELSRSLEAQHTTAQSTISMLESKVTALESLVQVTQSQVQAQAETQQQLLQAAEAARLAAQQPTPPLNVNESAAEEHAKEKESLTKMINEWKKNVEGRWSGVQEEWNEERDRLRRAKEEWEARVRAVENGLESTNAKVDTGLATIASFQVLQRPQPNGHAKLSTSGGLVTPPSPRSLSAESTRPRQKKRRTSSTRGRTRSRSRSPAPPPVELDQDDASSSFSGLRRRSSWETESNASDGHPGLNGSAKQTEGEVRKSTITQYPITPEPSLLEQPISGASSTAAAAMTDTQSKDPPKVLVRSHKRAMWRLANGHVIPTAPSSKLAEQCIYSVWGHCRRGRCRCRYVADEARWVVISQVPLRKRSTHIHGPPFIMTPFWMVPSTLITASCVFGFAL